ncbi:hypothetical protein DERP_015062 [Dermatophagoides pteronyssinus]|uniref:Uncharacterized protein n=1 Tax=Dermatophagoides pteronyssinus TaxID=6956 RepID=A0ABQ8JRB6_DERPT|nr:hypothetical protein DERP_015062 [Dermatophagoides pteronyssinus]
MTIFATLENSSLIQKRCWINLDTGFKQSRFENGDSIEWFVLNACSMVDEWDSFLVSKKRNLNLFIATRCCSPRIG